jgi:hypothetical protein
MGFEFPSVITAFNILSVEVPAGKRHAAVGTRVVHGEGFALNIAAENQRSFEQRRFLQAIANESPAW